MLSPSISQSRVSYPLPGRAVPYWELDFYHLFNATCCHALPRWNQKTAKKKPGLQMATKSKKYQPTPCLRSQFLITDFLNVSNTSITVQEVKKGCGEPIPSFAVTLISPYKCQLYTPLGFSPLVIWYFPFSCSLSMYSDEILSDSWLGGRTVSDSFVQCQVQYALRLCGSPSSTDTYTYAEAMAHHSDFLWDALNRNIFGFVHFPGRTDWLQETD